MSAKIHRLLTAIAFVGLAGVAAAQVPTLTVTNASSAKRIKTLSKDADGSFNKQTDRSVALNINMTPLKDAKGGYDIEWFFLLKPIGRKGSSIFDAGSKHSEKGAAKFPVSSKPIQEMNSRSKAYSVETIGDSSAMVITTTDTTSGSKFSGWVVRVKTGGEVVRVEASLSELKELATRNPELFDKALAELGRLQ